MSSFMETIRNKTGMSPIVVIGGVLSSLVLIFACSSFEIYIAAITGILYPAYMSMKAIASPDEDDDKQWCTYWTVFFTFELVEKFFGYLLHFLPFYFVIKLVFLIWLFFPTTQGATVLYEKVLRHFWSKYESDIDSALNNVSEKVKKGVANAKQTVNDVKGNIINKFSKAN